MVNSAPASVWRNPIHFLAFGLGSGAAPKAPGTFGTLAAVPLFMWFLQDLTATAYFIVLVVTSLLGVYLCGKTSKDMGVHDHAGIVWDEFVGFYIVLGFVLFRLFDILKPWPISWVDKNIHGGFGIMLDDILAGVMSFVVLQALVAFVF